MTAAHEPERCFVCGARDWLFERKRAMHQCSHCGVALYLKDYRANSLRALAAQTMRPGFVDMETGPWREHGVQADAFTLRILASAFGLGFEPGNLAQAAALAHPHSKRSAKGWLVPFAPAPKRVALGVIVSRAALDEVLERIMEWAHRFAEVVLLVDGDEPIPLPPAVDGVPLTALLHPLKGDFGAQRNRVQSAATAPWVLQFDADETPSKTLLHTMDALTARLDAQAVISIGLPRRNLVGGVLSDLYPDLQYRLNRRELRYRDRVHERPDLKSAWRRSTIAPSLTIDHHLSVERVRARSEVYGTMERGGERRSDEAALLRPFRP